MAIERLILSVEDTCCSRWIACAPKVGRRLGGFLFRPGFISCVDKKLSGCREMLHDCFKEGLKVEKPMISLISVGHVYQQRCGIYRKLLVWNPRFCRILGSVFFQDELNRFFRLPDEAERVWDPPELIGICWGNRQAQAGSISRWVSDLIVLNR